MASHYRRSNSVLPLFNDSITMEIIQHLYFSNYSYNFFMEFPKVYYLSLFSLTKIGEIIGNELLDFEFTTDEDKKLLYLKFTKNNNNNRKKSTRKNSSSSIKKSSISINNMARINKSVNNNSIQYENIIKTIKTTNLKKLKPHVVIIALHSLIEEISQLQNDKLIEDEPSFIIKASNCASKLSFFLNNKTLFNQMYFNKQPFDCIFNQLSINKLIDFPSNFTVNSKILVSWLNNYYKLKNIYSENNAFNLLENAQIVKYSKLNPQQKTQQLQLNNKSLNIKARNEQNKFNNNLQKKQNIINRADEVKRVLERLKSKTKINQKARQKAINASRSASQTSTGLWTQAEEAEMFFDILNLDYKNALDVAKEFKNTDNYIPSLQNSLIKYNDIQKLTTYYSILTPEVKLKYNLMYNTIKKIFDDYGGSGTKTQTQRTQPVAVPS